MLCFMVALVLIRDDNTSRIDRLITRHDDNLGAIHSIRATIEGRISSDGGQTWKPMYTMEVRRSGGRERLHVQNYGSRVANEWREEFSIRDYAYSPSETRTMSGLDPDHPPRLPLSGEEVSRIKGNILASAPIGAHGHTNMWTSALLLVPDPRYSLRELFAASRTKSCKHVDIEGVDETWDIGLNAPDGKFSYTITLIPSKSYAIGKLATRYADTDTTQNKATTYTRRVVEYIEVLPDLFLPRVIQSTQSTLPNKVSEVTLKNVAVNQPIPESDLTLEFPPGAIVYDFSRKTYHIWGDGEPARTFDSNEEFGAWNNERMRALMAVPRASSRGWWWVAAFLTATASLIGLFLLRRKMLRTAAA